MNTEFNNRQFAKPTLLTIGGLAAILFGLYSAGVFNDPTAGGQTSVSKLPTNISVDAKRSYKYLTDICALGSRTSGTPGMAKQQAMLNQHFTELGATVTMQPFTVRHPLTGDRVNMSNMVVTWHPEREKRVLLCAHYDTRPFPDRDPIRANRDGLFLGANDGASGTAVLCELAHHMKELDGAFGVDFVLFDGEELVYDDRRDNEWYFQGSTVFAKNYAANPPDHKYNFGILLDMVGDKELHLYYEVNSRKYARPLVESVWKTAKRLGVREFVPRIGHNIRDDHLPLNQYAKIPTIDIIDFDYPRPGRLNYWHTTEDKPENCSGESLAKVGWVVLEWLRELNMRN